MCSKRMRSVQLHILNFRYVDQVFVVWPLLNSLISFDLWHCCKALQLLYCRKEAIDPYDWIWQSLIPFLSTIYIFSFYHCSHLLYYPTYNTIVAKCWQYDANKCNYWYCTSHGLTMNYAGRPRKQIAKLTRIIEKKPYFSYGCSPNNVQVVLIELSGIVCHLNFPFCYIISE